MTSIPFTQFKRVHNVHFFHPVLNLPAEYPVYDFSQTQLDDEIAPGSFGVGRYLEKREKIYTAEIFEGARNIHLGVDLFAPVGTEVFSFTNGRILHMGYNSAKGDYGYTIVTEHFLEGQKIYALYGHLSAKSLENKKPGDELESGTCLGFLGDRHENGGYMPHLHFQLSYERPTTHDMPGTTSEKDLEDAKRKFPDPRIVLGEIY